MEIVLNFLSPTVITHLITLSDKILKSLNL